MARILTPIAVVDLNPKQGIGLDLPFEGERLFDVNYLNTGLMMLHIQQLDFEQSVGNCNNTNI